MSAYGRSLNTNFVHEDQSDDHFNSFDSIFSTDIDFDPSDFGDHEALEEPDLAGSGPYWPGDATVYLGNQPYGHIAGHLTSSPFENGDHSNPGYFTNVFGQNAQHYTEPSATRPTTEGSGLPPSRQMEWYTTPNHWAGVNATTFDFLPSLTHSSASSNGASSPSAYSSSSGLAETHIPEQISHDTRLPRPHRLPISRAANGQGSARGTRSRANRPVEELRCSEPGCRSPPFHRPYELHRHEGSAHSRIRYRCVECQSQNISYSRNRADKILEHYTKKHKNSVQRSVEKYELGGRQHR